MARRRRHSARGDSAPGWVWMLFGLSLGLAVAFGAYLHGRSGAPARTPTAAAMPAPAESPAASEDTQAAAPRRPATPSRAQAEREAAAARFDFYEILPQFEVVVPEVETEQRRTAGTAPRPVEEPGSYVLQAGSFTSAADADRMQANLALLGIEARIQRVTIDDAVFHRVRIGPISDLAELDRVRTRLRDARIDTLLMRVQ